MAMTTQPAGERTGMERGRKRRKRSRPASTLKKLLTDIIGEDRYLRLRAKRRIARGQPLLLVHSMGKVGSTTIAASLQARGIRRTMNMYQLHFLSDEGIVFAEELAISRAGHWDNLTRKGRAGYIRNRLLNKELDRLRRAGSRIKVITLVRDPLATNLSGLFHNYRWWPSVLKTQCAEPTVVCLDAVKQYFLDEYPHDVPNTWFDIEIRAPYGIDVFTEPFEPQKGYAIYHNDFADLLLIKLEKLNECAAEAMRDFMGLEDFHLVESNVAEEKDYAAIYAAFRREVALPANYLDRMYDSRLARHFYSPEEIASFRRKWSSASETRVQQPL